MTSVNLFIIDLFLCLFSLCDTVRLSFFFRKEGLLVAPMPFQFHHNRWASTFSTGKYSPEWITLVYIPARGLPTWEGGRRVPVLQVGTSLSVARVLGVMNVLHDVKGSTFSAPICHDPAGVRYRNFNWIWLSKCLESSPVCRFGDFWGRPRKNRISCPARVWNINRVTDDHRLVLMQRSRVFWDHAESRRT